MLTMSGNDGGSNALYQRGRNPHGTLPQLWGQARHCSNFQPAARSGQVFQETGEKGITILDLCSIYVNNWNLFRRESAALACFATCKEERIGILHLRCNAA